jgi:hypothetical protein
MLHDTCMPNLLQPLGPLTPVKQGAVWAAACIYHSTCDPHLLPQALAALYCAPRCFHGALVLHVLVGDWFDA